MFRIGVPRLLFRVKKFERKFFWVNQLYNYLLGFMKCRVIFLGLELEKSLKK